MEVPMSRRSPRHFTPGQKAEVIRRHVVDKAAASELCNQHDLQPSVFYGWLNHLFQNAAKAFTSSRPSRSDHQAAERISSLEAKLVKKDSVIAEISAEYVQLK